MITPSQPYTQEELDRIEAMIATSMADPVKPAISPELSRELAEFRLACEAADKFLWSAWAFISKYGKPEEQRQAEAQAAKSAALPEGW